MERSEVVDKVLTVFRTVLGEIPGLSEKTSAADLAQWDSLNHVILIQELEKAFNLKFDLFQIIEIRDVVGLTDAIYSQIKP